MRLPARTMQIHSRFYPPEHPRRQRLRAMFIALDAKSVQVAFEVLDRTCWVRSISRAPRRRPPARIAAAADLDFREFVLALLGTNPAVPSSLDRVQGTLDWDVAMDVFATNVAEGGLNETPLV